MRAQNRCEYCLSRADFATETFAVDHIVPISMGGSNELDNLALACSGCNGRKHNKLEGFDPITGQLAPTFNPRQQKWNDHFAWNEDFTLVIGLTATGRATLHALDMNRHSLINIRMALYVLGKHPPYLAVD
jgi:hypothetical protein